MPTASSIWRALCAAFVLSSSAALAADATMVFSEVMYHPAGSGSEWIEFHNELSINLDLSGWRITGGVNYTFPEGATITAGGYLVVAANPGALQTEAGLTGVLGPWTGALSNGDETITLKDRTGRVMDEFSYKDSAPFPVAADGGGVSLAKRDVGLASGDAANWTASRQIGGTPSKQNFASGVGLGPEVVLSDFAASWNYNQTGVNLGSTWAGSSYSAGTGGWLSGPGVFAFGSSGLPLPVGTALADPEVPITTHYFQRTFTFSGDPARTVLQLSTLLDDGAIVYLNGTEVTRVRLPGGTVSSTTLASSEVTNPVVASPLTLPTSALHEGANVLSVELHQAALAVFPPLDPSGNSGYTATPSPGFSMMRIGTDGTTTPVPDNFALVSAGGVAFGSSELHFLENGTYKYLIASINDGRYGSLYSWLSNLSNSIPQYIGVRFAALSPISRIAFGRDNTGVDKDRSVGTYTLQYTRVAAPGTGTTETENADTGWKAIGSIAVLSSNATFTSYRRHEFSVLENGQPFLATGIRIKVSDPKMCIDELEAMRSPTGDAVFGLRLTAQAILPPAGDTALVLNEIGGSSDGVWKLELRNTSSAPLDLGGMVIAASNATAGYTLPAQTLASGALLVVDQGQLGFRPPLDGRVFLYSAGRAELLDAAGVKATVQARSGSNFLTPTTVTFGAANTFNLQSDIVINELMYHHALTPGNPPTDNPEEWVELYNKGSAPVDLAGWKFDQGIDYSFPAGTMLAASEYLVIAKDSAALKTEWPEQASRIIGNFSGSLSNSGERLLLLDAVGNPACDFTYLTGGAWPGEPDGHGSSLELRDPRADLSNGAAWGASVNAPTGWQTITYTMTSGQTFGQTRWNEFRFGMLEAGECLIDDVSVKRVSTGQELIQGGNFESLSSKWRVLGNHGQSVIEAEPGNPGNTVLHVKASGTYSTEHNHIETTFLNNTALADGQNYTVSFRARWLRGSNLLNARSYSSRLARTTALNLPIRFGTPGAINSQRTTTLGPTLAALSHSPLIPAVNEAVTVSVKAGDPDGVAALTLKYSLDGQNFFSVGMTESNGTWSGQIPGMAAGKLVQFFVEARDNAGNLSMLPSAGPASRAFYVVEDGQTTSLSAQQFRVLMFPAEAATMLAPLNRMSDAYTGGTVIYARREAFYDIGVRLKGTAAGRVRDGDDYVSYDVGFKADHLFRGVHDTVNLDRSGRTPVVKGQDEIYVKHMFHRAGLACGYDDLVYFISPTGVHTGTALLQTSGYNSTFVDDQYGGASGAIFNLDGAYDPNTTSGSTDPESLKPPVPLQSPFWPEPQDYGADKEQYRGGVTPRAGAKYDDFTGVIGFMQTMSLPNAQLAAQLGSRIDVDQWMRCIALHTLCGITDTYFAGVPQHNIRFWVPRDGTKIQVLPWDMDYVFDAAATSGINRTGGNLLRFMSNSQPALRAYYAHLRDLCNTVFTASYMQPWLTHYGTVVGQPMASQITYITQRRASVLSTLAAAVPDVAFSITTNGGAAFAVNAPTATLAGKGSLNVREFRRADTGEVLAATWTSLNTWQFTVALTTGANLITIQAFDFQGAPAGSASITITSNDSTPRPRDFLRVTELMYHPAAPVGNETSASADAEDFEFIKLCNLGTQPLDISGCQFTKGVDFVFPANTILAAGERIHVVRNIAAFQARYGNGLRVAGAYGPADALSNSGETLTLLDASNALIQSFTYSDASAWPASADGGGYSLVPIAPQAELDRDNPVNWRPSTTVGGNPGSSDATIFTGTPGDDLDRDGFNAFLEYALGTSDLSPNVSGQTLVQDGATLLFTFQHAASADDVAYTIQGATIFGTWSTAIATRVSIETTAGRTTETWRITPTGAPYFVRLKVTSR